MCELRMWPRKHFGMHCNSSLNCYYVASQLNTNIKILAENSFFFQAFFTLSKQNTQNTQTNLFTFWRENCGIFGRFPFCFTQPSNSQDWARLSKMSIATFFAIFCAIFFMNFNNLCGIQDLGLSESKNSIVALSLLSLIHKILKIYT